MSDSSLNTHTLSQLTCQELQQIESGQRDAAYWASRSEAEFEAAHAQWTNALARSIIKPWPTKVCWGLSGLYVLGLVLVSARLSILMQTTGKWDPVSGGLSGVELFILGIFAWALMAEVFDQAKSYLEAHRYVPTLKWALEQASPLKNRPGYCERVLKLIATSSPAQQYQHTVLSHGRQFRMIDLMIVEDLVAEEEFKRLADTQEATCKKLHEVA